MFKQLRKANQNDYLLITATLILLVVFNLSLLSYVQGQQKAAERDQAQALATGCSRTLKGEIKNALTLSATLKELVLASDGKVDNFSTVAKYLLAENTAVRNWPLGHGDLVADPVAAKRPPDRVGQKVDLACFISF